MRIILIQLLLNTIKKLFVLFKMFMNKKTQPLVLNINTQLFTVNSKA